MDSYRCLIAVDSQSIGQLQCQCTLMMSCKDAKQLKRVDVLEHFAQMLVMYFVAAIAALWFALLDDTSTFCRRFPAEIALLLRNNSRNSPLYALETADSTL